MIKRSDLMWTFSVIGLLLISLIIILGLTRKNITFPVVEQERIDSRSIKLLVESTITKANS